MVWDAAVVSSVVGAPIRDKINLPLCLTTRFLRCTPLGVLPIDRSAMWRWLWLMIKFLRYPARGFTVQTRRRAPSICSAVKRGINTA